MNRSILNLFIVFLIISVSGCGPKQSHVNDEPTFSKIIIQIFPIFCTHSQILLDVKNTEMIFDMIGDVRFIKEDGNYDMKPFYYKFNTEESKYLNDSILEKFGTKDFADSFLDIEDGIDIDILYIFSDGKSKKIELYNSTTPNQHKLISFLMESLISNSSDSTTKAYSKLINRFY